MTMPISGRHGHCDPPFGGEAISQINCTLKNHHKHFSNIGKVCFDF
jgi:hypothetical protein